EKAIAVRKNFDPSLPRIKGDRAQLTQVFLNLIRNAFQSMEKAGALTITTRLETDFYVREQGSERNRFIWGDITDEGAGIKEEDLPHIFSPFFTTTTNGGGLVMSVCYRIKNGRSGDIRVDSG